MKCDSNYEFDLTFVGTAWPNRVSSLNKILSALPEDINPFLCLPWNRHIPEPQIEGIDIIPQLRMDISDLCDIWNRSRIVLTIGREFSLNPKSEQQSQGIHLHHASTRHLAGVVRSCWGSHFQYQKIHDLIPIVREEEAAAELIKEY